MMKSTYFNHLDRQEGQISLHILGWQNILSRQPVYMGKEFWAGGCSDLLITEACSRIAFILEPDLTLWQIHSMVDARNQRVHIQTTAAGQWGEGVQPEPPKPSARDGGADTKKPANDPVGVAASSGQVEDLGLASGPPKRPDLCWGAPAAPSPSSLLQGKALAGGAAPDGERLAPQKAGDPEGKRPAGDTECRKGTGRRRPGASSTGNTGIPRQWDGEAAV